MFQKYLPKLSLLSGPYIAGSAALSLYVHKDLSIANDIDIFCNSKDQFLRVSNDLIDKFDACYEESVGGEYENSEFYTYRFSIAEYEEKTFNIVYTTRASNVIDCLNRFDLTTAQVATDLKKFYTTEKAKEDIAAKQVNFVNSDILTDPYKYSVIEKRIAKYSKKGFDPSAEALYIMLKQDINEDYNEDYNDFI